MSEQQKRFKAGDHVLVRGQVTLLRDNNCDVRLPNGVGLWSFEYGNVVMPAPERKPWDVLREAAEIMWQRDCFEADRILRKEADRLERAAAPPDPVDVLQEVEASVFMPGLPPQLRERIRAAIAAHDAKKDRADG